MSCWDNQYSNNWLMIFLQVLSIIVPSCTNGVSSHHFEMSKPLGDLGQDIYHSCPVSAGNCALQMYSCVSGIDISVR